jgi:hypothetical protein
LEVYVGFCIRPVGPQFGERNSGHRAGGTEKGASMGPRRVSECIRRPNASQARCCGTCFTESGTQRRCPASYRSRSSP